MKKTALVFVLAVLAPSLVLAWLAVLSHILLDYTNNYGVHPYWPFDNRWIYGDSVFIVTDLSDDKRGTYRGVRQQFVRLGPARGDQVAVVEGVAAGDEVVTSGVFRLRNGAAVQINNTVRPANDPAPSPENS